MQIKSDVTVPLEYEYFGIEMTSCDSLNQIDVDCATSEEREKYWQTAKHEFLILIAYKQVDMKNSTLLLPTVTKYFRKRF